MGIEFEDWWRYPVKCWDGIYRIIPFPADGAELTFDDERAEMEFEPVGLEDYELKRWKGEK